MSTPETSQSKRNRPIGQSLVETALFLPLIIFLLAGVLELSNLLVTQNRVAAAARSGTRFAAANFGDDEWASWENVYATEVANVALNNVTETLDLDPARWDIWAIKATIVMSGGAPAFTEWRPVHINDGITETVMTRVEWNARESQIQADILTALGNDIPLNGNMEIVATDAYHDRHAFLGLVPYDLGAFTRIRGFTVMRVDESVGTYGACDTFPIAVSLDNYSVFPADYHPGDELDIAGRHFSPGELNEVDFDPDPNNIDRKYEWYPFYNFAPDADPDGDNLHEYYGRVYGGNGTSGNAKSVWDYGAYYYEYKLSARNASQVPPPYYTLSNTSTFPYNQPGRHISEAQRGDLFVVKQVTESPGGSSSAFGWLRWSSNPPNNQDNSLGTSLTWPGNSSNYCYNEATCFNDPGEPAWSADGQINRFDRIRVRTGVDRSVEGLMMEHVDEGVNGRLLRLLVFTPPDYPDSNPNDNIGDANNDSWGTDLSNLRGGNATFEVYGFVLGRIVGYHLQGQGNWLLLEFHGWDVDCVASPAAVPSPTPTTAPYP